MPRWLGSEIDDDLFGDGDEEGDDLDDGICEGCGFLLEQCSCADVDDDEDDDDDDDDDDIEYDDDEEDDDDGKP